jgi:hypothetical protein
MDEDRPEDPSHAPDSGRAKRPPPTIDLEASEVSTTSEAPAVVEQTQPEQSQAQQSQAEPTQKADAAGPSRRSRSFPWMAVSAGLVAAVTGAITAALVVAIASAVGWPGETAPPPASPQTNASAIDTLASRLADLETRTAKPAAAPSDPAVIARLDAVEKSLASLSAGIAGVRAQSEKLAADLNAVKSAPRETASPDLTAINGRLSELERASRADSAEIAKALNKPADDTALRRVVAASMLDIAVRQGEPFVAPLAAAKVLAANPDTLKPLDVFAASGVPNPASLSRDLLALVPKLSPPAPENSTTGTGIIDRLQAGAAKLVRIERSNVVGNDRSAVVARVTAAALRNDLAEARRELNSLSPGDRAAAQAWLDKANERDAALEASHQFAAEAMVALAKPGQ